MELQNNTKNYPIGVFDSGMGGLTVLRELCHTLPHENFIYLGDTARLPYGTKSRETIIQYAVQNAKILIELGIKLLVIGCNTASAVALPSLKKNYPNIPILGVIEPGAEAALSASKNRHIAILATESTINAGSYEAAIKHLDASAVVIGKSCGLLVALAEEGWTNNSIAQSIIREYLQPLKGNGHKFDCVVLGCTHFPIFSHLIQQELGAKVAVVDSAQSTAKTVKRILHHLQIETTNQNDLGEIEFLVTDLPQRFARIGEIFLNAPINSQQVKLVETHSLNPKQTPSDFMNLNNIQ